MILRILVGTAAVAPDLRGATRCGTLQCGHVTPTLALRASMQTAPLTSIGGK